MRSTIILLPSVESISNFALSLTMFHMPDSCTNNAAHREQNSIAADAQCISHDIQIVVHASAHDVLNPLEVLAEEEAVETCDQSCVGINQGVDC